MPKPVNVLLTAAAVGGAAYYYDQNVQPLWSKRKVVPFHEHSLEDDVRRKANQFDSKARKFGDKVVAEAKNGKEEVARKTELTLDQIKNSDFVNRISAQSEDYKRTVENRAVPIADKSLPYRVVDRYIDGVNELGERTAKAVGFGGGARPTGEKWRNEIEKETDSWFNWFGSKKEDAKADLKQAKQEAKETKSWWSSWGLKKVDEAEAKAEQKKNEWLAWGSKKADEAEQTKDSWVSWGSKKADEVEARAKGDTLGDTLAQEKQRAIDQYYKAKSNVESLTAKLADSLTPQEKDKHLEQAQKDLNSSLTNLKKYGSDLADSIDKQYFQPLKSKAENLTK